MAIEVFLVGQEALGSGDARARVVDGMGSLGLIAKREACVDLSLVLCGSEVKNQDRGFSLSFGEKLRLTNFVKCR